MPRTQDMETRVVEESSPRLCDNEHLLRWVEETAALTNPAAIHWVDGSQAEYDLLCRQMVAGGALIKLNQELLPGCYYARGSGRGPDIHLFSLEGRRGAHEQLARPAGNAR
jgi:GTP-dependent phosphoenolpyruvate carboxykinase